MEIGTPDRDAALLRRSVAERRMYASDPYAYDFDRELRSAIERTTIRHYWRAELQRRARAAVLNAACPRSATVEQYVNHARKFGLDSVLETARELLTPAEVAVIEAETASPAGKNGKPAVRRRRTTDRLRDQVLALQARGLMPAAIADQLNIGDRRARTILATLATSENGGRKRLEQAEENVDYGLAHTGTCPDAKTPENGGGDRDIAIGQIDIFDALNEVAPAP